MRYSRQRNLILDIVRSTDTHPTADWIYRKAKLTMPSIGIATVYRDLSTLVDSGEIRKISLSGSEDRFDRDTSDHVHMRCSECGALIDMRPAPGKSEDKLLGVIKTTFGITDPSAKLGETLITGLCNSCRRKASTRS